MKMYNYIVISLNLIIKSLKIDIYVLIIYFPYHNIENCAQKCSFIIQNIFSQGGCNSLLDKEGIKLRREESKPQPFPCPRVEGPAVLDVDEAAFPDHFGAALGGVIAAEGLGGDSWSGRAICSCWIESQANHRPSWR